MRREQYQGKSRYSDKGKLGMIVDRGDGHGNRQNSSNTGDILSNGVTVTLPGVNYEKCQDTVVGMNIVSGQVDGIPVTVLRDTGSSSVFVHSKLVPRKPFKGRIKKIMLADGTCRDCNEVCVSIETPYLSGTVLALVLDMPMADLVIGNCVTVSSQEQEDENRSNSCQVMQTRSQTRSCEKEQANKETSDFDIEKNECLIDDEIGNSFSKAKPMGELYNSKVLKEEQKLDSSLDKVRSLVVTEVDPGMKSCFVEKDGILYRIFNREALPHVEQIVVPTKYRERILHLGHDIPVSGHLGNKKTRERIMQHFYGCEESP